MALASIADLSNGAGEFLEEAAGLSKLYDRFIQDDQRDVRERLPGIHASEISGCKRKIVYSLLGYDRQGTLSKNWAQRFKFGHAAHRMVQQDFHKLAKNSGGFVSFEDEIPIAPHLQSLAEKWFINSSTDGLFTFFEKPYENPYMRLLLEFKTESPDQYEKLKGPHAEHIEQCHVYMAALDVPVTWILYLNKGNQNNTPSEGPYLVRFNPALWAKLEARFQECHDFADKEVLPPRDESMVCEFCSFAWHCQPKYLRGDGGQKRRQLPMNVGKRL